LVAAIRIKGILRLSSAACRQVPENSRTFPPFEKGGSGGISHEKGGSGGISHFLHPRPLHHYPINLLHHRFRFYHYFPAVKIPPAPFGKGGDIWGFLWPIVKSPRPPLAKGEIFGVSFGLSLKSPRPPLQKGEIFGVSFGLSLKSPRPPLQKGEIFGVSFGLMKSPRPPLRKGEIFWPLRKGGDILRLFSDRMPERIACRQVSENSRTFPPLKKGGQGGFPMKKGGWGGFPIFYIPALSITTR
jgi:hypothetical protein